MTLHPAQLAGEEDRVRQRIKILRGLITALESELDAPGPPGPGVAQAVAGAAVDLAVYVARIDLLRRIAGQP